MGRAYGFFGGTFDPIHRGHLALAQAALRERGLARVYFVPARRSPLKRGSPTLSARDRVGLVRVAIHSQPRFSLGRWELNRPDPSYTYQTLRGLRKRFPTRIWEVILGEDAWATFPRWRRAHEIARAHVLVVGVRKGAGPRTSRGAVFLRTRLPAVSSTEVREALATGRSVRRWVSLGVAEWIEKRGFYR